MSQHSVPLYYTSGQKSVDVEKGNCLMNTYWNTVWSNRHHRALSLFSSTAWLDCVSRACAAIQRIVAVPVPNHISRFQAWGSNPLVEAIFSLFSFSQLSATVNQRRIFLNNFIDWLIWVVIGVTWQKIALTGIRTPDLETWNLKWKWNCHSMLNCSTRSTRSQATL